MKCSPNRNFKEKPFREGFRNFANNAQSQNLILSPQKPRKQSDAYAQRVQVDTLDEDLFSKNITS